MSSSMLNFIFLKTKAMLVTSIYNKISCRQTRVKLPKADQATNKDSCEKGFYKEIFQSRITQYYNTDKF